VIDLNPCPLCGSRAVHVVRKPRQEPTVVCMEIDCACRATLASWQGRVRHAAPAGRIAGTNGVSGRIGVELVKGQIGGGDQDDAR